MREQSRISQELRAILGKPDKLFLQFGTEEDTKFNLKMTEETFQWIWLS